MRFIVGQIYNKLIAYPLVIIAIVQLILICIAFNKIVFHLNDYLFINFGDGLKNYFTLYQYIVQEKSPLGMWHFTGMNYPFGEYIFFTDNTPILALIMRFVHQHIINIEKYIVCIHNYFFLFLQLILPLFFYKLFEIKNRAAIIPLIILSIGASWISPQILKLIYGVYNFSIGLLPVLMLFIFKDLYRFFTAGLGNKWIIGAKIFSLIFISGLFHIYYVAILALPIGVFLAIFILPQLFRKKWKTVFATTFFYFFLFGGGFTLHFLVNFVDSYSSNRLTVAQGFGYQMWRLTPEAIITPYVYNTVIPIFRSCSYKNITGESMSYLGAFFIFNLLASLCISFYFLFKKKFNLRHFLNNHKQYKFYFSILIVAFFVYATASGPYVQFCIIPLSLDNWFSIFYFFYKKVDMITQFRCLARFNWPGFWIMLFLGINLFQFIFIYLFNKNKLYAYLFVAPLLTVMIIDTKDTLKYLNTFRYQNILNSGVINNRFQKLDAVNFKDYQAIYTLPAVIVGSENYNITLNDQAYWTEYWMQLSIYSGLPLFNCKMSRTAENQAQAQFDIVNNQKVDSLILDRIIDKKVLVIYWPEGEKNYDVPVEPKAHNAAFEGSKIIKQFKMDSLTTLDGVIFYEWDIKTSGKLH